MYKKYCNMLYRNLFKRSSTFTLSIIVATMFFERAYDNLIESIFEKMNEGRLWMHIKHRYEDNIDMPPTIPEIESEPEQPTVEETKHTINKYGKYGRKKQ